MRRRILAAGLLVAAAIAMIAVLTGGDNRYMARVVLKDAGGLRKGANVRVGGAPVGRVVALNLDRHDRADAELRIEKGSAPLGAGARALVQADGFFGERYVELTRGDLKRPQPSGTVIPTSRSAVSVRLDDVVDALDVDTRSALQVFLREQGTAVVGRGRSLASVLESLPPGLARTGELIDQFASDNRALGQLVERSDRVVGTVARDRSQLGRLIGGADATFGALASRRAGLGETVRRAPATLRQARRTLVSLQGAAIPLAPAARGLRATAPSLTTTLQELPRFTKDAVPALNTAAKVGPQLRRLAIEGTPAVRHLEPLTGDLTRYSRRALGPFTEELAKGTPDLFGVMEGWARSTQGRDAASQVFRFGASSSSDTFAELLKAQAKNRRRRTAPAGGQAPSRAEGPKPAVRQKPPNLLELPKLPKPPKLPNVPDDLLQKPSDTLNNALKGGGGSSQSPLLDFLLGP